MKTLTISVPDKNCRGCSYLQFVEERDREGYMEEKTYCAIFKRTIQNFNKCHDCNLLAKNNSQMV